MTKNPDSKHLTAAPSGNSRSRPFFPAAPVRVQTKLTVNEPGDRFEKEADAVADKVISRKAESPAFISRSVSPAPVQRDETEEPVGTEEIDALAVTSIQRKCAACGAEDDDRHEAEGVQRQGESSPPAVSDSLAQSIDRRKGSGSPMQSDTREFMESSMGADFSGVRIHNDQEAAGMSNSIRAQAFTIGQDIYFNANQYNPSSDSGKHLLAHELTHVMQQNSGIHARQIQRAPGDCITGNKEGTGKQIAPDKMGNIYKIWSTWHATDVTIQGNIRRVFPLWLTWRYGSKLDETQRKSAIDTYIIVSRPYKTVAELVEGCQYPLLMDLDTYAMLNSMAGEATSSGGSGGKGGKGGGRKDAFSKLKDEEKTKIKELLKEWLGEIKSDSDKKKDDKIMLTDSEVKALLLLADNPNRTAIIEKLKGAIGNNEEGESKATLEELIAQAAIGETLARLGETPSEGSDQEPIERRPVTGYIKQGDPNIVPAKETHFEFVVTNDRDALRVPWINIHWHSALDPKDMATNTDEKAKSFNEEENTHYSPISSQGITNDKFFNIKFPAAGTYFIEAVVNHNFFTPNYFYARVVVIDEKALISEKETNMMKGFGQPGNATDDYKFNDASSSYDTGTKTTGEMDPAFKGGSLDDHLAHMQEEKKRIETLLETYKGKGGEDAQAVTEWATKYLDKLNSFISKYEAEGKISGTLPVAARGTYVSRTGGVRTGDLNLTCLIRKTTITTPTYDEMSEPITEPGYEVILFDYTQLYENENYRVTAVATTPDAAMEKAFVQHSTNYPFGTISIAFQKYDSASEQLTNQYIQFKKVTDTLGKDIKSVLFSTPAQIAVNVVSTVLTLFPPTTAVGMAIGIAYNGAMTLTELEEAASKDTLTLGKAMKGVGSIALDVVPFVGRGSKLISLGGKAYYAFEAAQYAGMAYLMYENSMEEVEKLRNGIIKELADIEAEIAKISQESPASDPRLKDLEKRRDQLIKKGQTAVADTLGSMGAQQLLMMVGSHVLNNIAQRRFATSRAELQEKGIFEHDPGKPLKYDYEKGKITGDGTTATPEQFSHMEMLADYDKQLSNAMKLSPDDMAKSADARKALTEKLASYGEVEIKPGGTETKLVKEGDKTVLHVGENSTPTSIGSVLDASGMKKTGTTPPAPSTPAPPKGAPDAKSPVTDKHLQTGVTPTKEIHEIMIHENGVISRCSDQCTTLLNSITDRAAKTAKNYPDKNHATHKEVEALQAKAKQIEKEAKANAKNKDAADKSAKDDALLKRAEELELEMAALESKVIPDIDARITDARTKLDTTLSGYSEYQDRYKKRMEKIEKRIKELASKKVSPDPAVREKAAKELLELEKAVLKTQKELDKKIQNTKLPNISETFKYDQKETKDRVYKWAEGKLGVPGKVQEDRSQSQQNSVSGGTGDDAGHLIANLFGGSGEAKNLSLQNFIANEYGSWKMLENSWAAKLKAGTEIRAKVTDIYRKGEDRPFMRRAEWTETVDGKTTAHTMDFMNPHTPESRDKQKVKPTVTGDKDADVIDINRGKVSPESVSEPPAAANTPEPPASSLERERLLKQLTDRAAFENAPANDVEY